MGSDKGILARAIAGGFKGGTEALRQKDVLTEKFAWGDEVARQARQANLERFGQQKELATLQSGLGVSAAQTTRRLKREEDISATQQSLKAKMEALGSSPEDVEEAMEWAGAGLSPAIIQGTPGKPLTAEASKQVAEAVDKLMPDATPEERMKVAGEMEAKITAGTYGLKRAATAAEAQREAAKLTAANKQTIDRATTGLTKSLISNPKQAIRQFESLASNKPELAREVLSQLEEQGGHGMEIKAMRNILRQGVRERPPVMKAPTEVGRPEAEAFGVGAGAILPPVGQAPPVPTRVTPDVGRPVPRTARRTY